MGTCPIIEHTPAVCDDEVRNLDGTGQCVQFATNRIRHLICSGEFTVNTCRLLLLHQKPSHLSSAVVIERGFVFHVAVATFEHGTWYYESSLGKELGHIKCTLNYKLSSHPPLLLQLVIPHHEMLQTTRSIKLFTATHDIELPLNQYKVHRLSTPRICDNFLFSTEENFLFSKEEEEPFVIDQYDSREARFDNAQTWFAQLIILQ